MSRKKNNPYITQGFCDERFGRILDKLNAIDEKVGDVKTDVEKIRNGVSEHRWQPKYYVPIVVSIIALLGTVANAFI